jgi:hypothetical protein
MAIVLHFCVILRSTSLWELGQGDGCIAAVTTTTTTTTITTTRAQQETQMTMHVCMNGVLVVCWL